MRPVSGSLLQDDDLGILPADFHEGSGLRAVPFHHERCCQNFLDELRPDQVRKHDCRRNRS